ncbi:glycosyltransferase, partial [Vibrio splendidus]|uniref:glycosyltransferase n=1 Tax=Vibrio splendidus TaxID=29497 RepID=UPI0024694CCB
MSKNILYIVNGLGAGGAEKLVVDIANHFSSRNNVTIISLTSDTFREADLSKSVNLNVFDLKKNITNIFGVFKFVIMRDFDVIHSHMPISIIFSRIIGLVFLFKKNIK